MLELEQEVFITTIDKLSLCKAKAHCLCAKFFFKGNNILEEKFTQREAEDFNIVLLRRDPPVDLDYINATYIFDFVDREKTLIINDTKAIRNFNESCMKFIPRIYARKHFPQIKKK